MGQYFRAVNTDKHEYICPWCIGGGAKLWEWAANPQGAIFTLLLRKSSGSGGGDYYGNPRMQTIEASTPAQLARAIQSAARAEGQPISPDPDTIVGRWAMDRIALVGDYDDSGLFDVESKYRNISDVLVDTWNGFIELDNMQLKYRPCSGCSGHS